MSTITRLFDHIEDALVYEAGAVITKEGTHDDKMYVVRQGEVDIVHDGAVINTLGAGEIFGEMALIDQLPHSASVIAKTRAEIVTVDEKRFSFMVAQTPFFAMYVMRVLSSRLRKISKSAT